jgi:hypothetical protein
VAVAEFSLTGASKKGPINHEFVNLMAEFADISPAVTGKSDEVAESRDRERDRSNIGWRRCSRTRKRNSGRITSGWPKEGQVGSWEGGKFEGRLDHVRTGLYGPTAFDSRRAERRDD